jgi:hypothetical protein
VKASGEAFLLSGSAFAPALLVHALVYIPGRPLIAALFTAVAAGLGALTGAYLRLAERRGTEQLVAQQIKPVTGESLGLFVTYALPMMLPIAAPSFPYATVAFCALLLVIMARSRLIIGNPMLTLLGYQLFEVEAESGVTYLVLRRRADYHVASTTLAVVRVADVCYLERGA